MKKYRKHLVAVFVAGILALLCFSPIVFSHCEIPCGIYNDNMRLDMMAEHIATIEKSMQQIHELENNKDKNYNQMIRWVINKENHSDYLCDIVTEYFMKQRLKPVDENMEQEYKNYIEKLTLLHNLMVYSMKCKQTTDLDNVAKLKQYLSQFRKAYSNIEASASNSTNLPNHKH